MEDQAQRFRDMFGRDPRPGSIFFDPDADAPHPLGLDTVS